MISAKPWSLDAVLRLFLGVIVSFLIGSVIAGSMHGSDKPSTEETLSFWQMSTLVLFFQGAALVFTAFFLKRSKMTWSAAFGLAPHRRTRAILYGLAVGIVALPIMWSLQSLSQFVMEQLHISVAEQAAVEALQSPDMPMVEKMILGLFTVLLAPVAEETLFRGVGYVFVKQCGYPRLAFWGSAVVFGVLHFNLAAFVPLAFFGLVLVFLYEFTDCLLAPIAAHCLFNGVNFLYLIFADPINKLLHLT